MDSGPVALAAVASQLRAAWPEYILPASQRLPASQGEEVSGPPHPRKSSYSPRTARNSRAWCRLAKPPLPSVPVPQSYSKRIKDRRARLGRSRKLVRPLRAVASGWNGPAKSGFSPGCLRPCHAKLGSIRRGRENSRAWEKRRSWRWLALSPPPALASGPYHFMPMSGANSSSWTASREKRSGGR